MNLPTGFHFRIQFKGLPGGETLDTGFQSIEGLEAHVSLHTENEKKAVVTYSSLILVRAVRPVNRSPLIQWFFANLNSPKIIPLEEAVIQLLDDAHTPYMQWTIKNITPKNWKLGSLHAEKSEVLLETIELDYTELVAGS